MQESTSSFAKPNKTRFYYLLFFLSGFPALLYQIVWQRTLFTLYGVNIESVTMIVTIFMLGLGMGSLAGGWLSARKGVRLLLAFGLIEFSVGTFGAASLWIFHRIGSFTAGASTTATGCIAFALLLVPTMLMGSTLPLLVEHFVRRTGNIGESVGLLYSVNTFGSAVACFAAALLLMRLLGEAGSIRLAVCFNLFVGTTALFLQVRDPAPALQKHEPQSRTRQETIPLWIGMLLAGVTGFIALAYEIVWYRLYSFASGGLAPSFAYLLGFYLLGIGYGSLAVRDACRQKLGNNLRSTLGATSSVVLLGAITAFLVGPALALWIVHFNSLSYIFVFIAAALLGSAFPLLSHAAIDPAQNSGKSISFIYVSNIVGSTLGSFLVGFVVLDHWSTRATSLLLLGLGFLVASVLAVLSGPKAHKGIFVAGSLACVALILGSGPLFSGIYERLLFKNLYKPGMNFSEVAEDRNGVIGIYPENSQSGNLNRIVFSGGAYDGQINTDIMHDSNMLFRAFVICGLHPKPKNVLIIGLATGAWAQVVANDPEVEQVTIVEINPGFLPLIRQHSEVESLLRNPKVHIVIDDGRRWLVGHPDRRFDFILMNTTFNWRANISNLLSTEFMGLLRAHLNRGGIAYYNTTWSADALATGATAFPYALRINSFLAVSDSPFTLDKNLWRKALSNYQIDGRPVFDLANPLQRARLEEVLHLADELDVPNGNLESRASLLHRLQGARLITDDNMGTEWSLQAARIL
jgi:predicted membrane-bound spermidine synthase